MRRFKNILVVADEVTRDDNLITAIKSAADLAEDKQTRLKVVGTLEELPSDADDLYKIVPRPKLRDMLIEHRTAELDELVAPLREAGIQVATKVLVGVPHVEIIREVLRDQHDLLIKPASGNGSLKTAFFGSTDMHLIRECPCPVWVAKPTKTKKYARILAALDHVPGDEENRRLNEKILEISNSLAGSEDSELHIVHAWMLYEEALLKLLIGNVDELARDTRASHEKWLDELLRDHTEAKDRIHVHLLEGKASDVIPTVAEQERVDLVVMGTLSRTQLPLRLIGRTAETLLNRLDCSVLTVNPEGFVSPVALD